MTKEDVNDVYKLITEQRDRIEALEAALREIDDISTCRIARRLASEALAPEQDK